MKNITNEMIKKLRKKANLTQEQMGALLDMKRSTYAHTESYGNFKPEHLKIIATHFGCSVDELLNGEDSTSKLKFPIPEFPDEPRRLEQPKFKYEPSKYVTDNVITFNERKLITMFRKLQPENKEMMLKLIEKLSTEE